MCQEHLGHSQSAKSHAIKAHIVFICSHFRTQGELTTDCDGLVEHEKWQEPAGTLNGSYRIQFLPWKGVQREMLMVIDKRGPSKLHPSRILCALPRIDDTPKVKALKFGETASLEWLYTSTGPVLCGWGGLSGICTEGLPRNWTYRAV